MRHIYIRGIVALIWLVIAIVGGVSGNMEMAIRCLLVSSVFGYATYHAWKKGQDGNNRT